MAHDLQVSRNCYKNSRNLRNLFDLSFSAKKHAFGVNPGDVDHRDLKLAIDGAKMTGGNVRQDQRCLTTTANHLIPLNIIWRHKNGISFHRIRNVYMYYLVICTI